MWSDKPNLTLQVRNSDFIPRMEDLAVGKVLRDDECSEKTLHATGRLETYLMEKPGHAGDERRAACRTLNPNYFDLIFFFLWTETL